MPKISNIGDVKPVLVKHESRESLAADAVNHILDAIEEALEQREIAHVSLTGGTMGVATLAAWGASERVPSIDWSRVHFWFSDERFVPERSEERNDGQAIEALLVHLLDYGMPVANVHRMGPADHFPSVADAAEHYAYEMRNFAGEAPERRVQIPEGVSELPLAGGHGRADKLHAEEAADRPAGGCGCGGGAPVEEPEFLETPADAEVLPLAGGHGRADKLHAEEAAERPAGGCGCGGGGCGSSPSDEPEAEAGGCGGGGCGCGSGGCGGDGSVEWPAPYFDVTLLGMGPDGHIASLFPGRRQVLLGTGLPEDPVDGGMAVTCMITDSPKPPAERVSVTLPIVNNSRRIFFLITGADKQDATTRLLAGAALDSEAIDASVILETPAAGARGAVETLIFATAESLA